MRFLESVKWSYLGTFVSKGLGFLFQILILRWLTPEDSASYFLTLTFVYLAFVIFLSPFLGIAKRYVPFYEKEKRKKLFVSLLSLIPSFLVILALPLISFFLLSTIINTIYPVFSGKELYVSLTFFFLGLFTITLELLRANKMFNLLAISDGLNSFLKVLLLLIFYLFFPSQLNFFSVMKIFFFSAFVSSLPLIFPLLNLLKIKRFVKLQFSEIAGMFKYSIGSSIELVRDFVSNWIDIAVLGIYRKPIDVSGYSGTFSLVRNIAVVILNPLYITSLPFLVSNINNKEYFELISKKLVKAFWYLSVLLTSILFFSSKDIVLILIPNYSSFHSLIQLFSLSIIFYSFSLLFRLWLNAVRWVKPLVYSSILLVLANLSLNLLLIPIFGVYGAAIATIISMILENLFLLTKIKSDKLLSSLPLFNLNPLALLVLLFFSLTFLSSLNLTPILSLCLKILVAFLISSLFLYFREKDDLDFALKLFYNKEGERR